MNDLDTLQYIRVAFDESNQLRDDADLIKSNKANEKRKKPISFINSQFGLWLYSEGFILATYSWFKDLMSLHQRVYEEYSSFYKKYYDSSNQQDKINDCSTLNTLINDYHLLLKAAEKELSNTSCNEKKIPATKEREVTESANSLSNDNKQELIEALETSRPAYSSQETTENTTKSKTEALFEKLEKHTPINKKEISPVNLEKTPQSSVTSSKFSNAQLKISKKLEVEKEKQFSLRKEIIEQELKQVEERQELFNKAVDQLSNHLKLKEKDTEFSLSKYKAQSLQFRESKKKKNSALRKLSNQKSTAKKELELMDHASNELEKENLNAQINEKEQLTYLNHEQSLIKKEIKTLTNRQNQKRRSLEKLKQQVLIYEQDLDNLIEDELQKYTLEKEITSKKTKKQNDIEQLLLTQQQERDNNLQREELKYQDLKQLKKQYFATQQDILRLEHDQQNLMQSKQESVKINQQELEQLKNQLNRKQEMLAILVIEHQKKNKKLNNVIKNHQQASTETSDSEALKDLEKLYALNEEAVT